jgi:hypothetical protein
MRRTLGLAITALALSLSAGIAQADVTDVLVVPTVGGQLTLIGAGAGTAAVPVGTAGALIGSSTAVPGATLTVSDLRGLTGGSASWSVTASYSTLAALSIVPTLPVGAVAADLGGANVTVTPSTATTAATNASLGVASPTLASGPLSSAVKVASAATGGNGLTAFTTSYAISIPAKATLGTAYTGAVVYTVAPTP